MGVRTGAGIQELAVRWARAGLLLALLALAVQGQVTKRFRINGQASASSDFAWGFGQMQVVCLNGPPAGSPPSAFVSSLVASINSVAGAGTARQPAPNVLRIKRPANFEFWVSSGCPAMHPPGQRVTDRGGLPVSFNPAVREVIADPDQGDPGGGGGPGPALSVPLLDGRRVWILALALVAAAALLLRPRN